MSQFPPPIPPQRPGPLSAGQHTVGQPCGPGVVPHRGVLILVLGILSLLLCAVLGIPACIMANGDLREMTAGRMDRSGQGMTQAGKVCGIVAVVLACVGIGILLLYLLFVLVILGGVAAGAAGAAGRGGP